MINFRKFAAPNHYQPQLSPIWIEVATLLQIPTFHLVGLPGPEVNEAKERVRLAIEASGFEFPRRKLVLNLTPARVRKSGTGLDLAMALGILAERCDQDLSPTLAWGELGLDGKIQPVGQSIRLYCCAIRNRISQIICHPLDAQPIYQNIQILRQWENTDFSPTLIVATTLKQAWELCLKGSPSKSEENIIAPSSIIDTPPQTRDELLPLTSFQRRIIGVTSSLGHHLLLLGAKGAGKSHAVKWIEALFPDPSAQSWVEQNLLAELKQHHSPPVYRPPIRRIGQGVRPHALTGTSSSHGITPGEFSLSHRGLLIADEILEWPRDSLEILREPLERGKITLTRAKNSEELPAQFQLIATANLCPCGGWPHSIPRMNVHSESPRCTCLPRSQTQYLKKLSGPLFDRIDLVMRWESGNLSTLQNTQVHSDANDFESLRIQCTEARSRSLEKYGCLPAQISPSALENIFFRSKILNPNHYKNSTYSSLRDRHKTLRIALSLSLWDQSNEPEVRHFFEAQHLRPNWLQL